MKRYTKEQIKPKRHPDEKPSEVNKLYWSLLTPDREYPSGWDAFIYCENGDWGVGYDVDWFIDVPGAPEELKPIIGTPSAIGKYIAHLKNVDIWNLVVWDNTETCYMDWRDLVDYFIPYNLERNDMEGKLDILLDWEIDKDTVHVRVGEMSKKDFTYICKQFLDDQGYDLTKREPEITPCPFCGCDLTMIKCHDGNGMPLYGLRCTCGYHSQDMLTPQEAIEKHNLIAKG